MVYTLENLTLLQLRSIINDSVRKKPSLFQAANRKEVWVQLAAQPQYSRLWQEIRRAGASYERSAIETLPYSEFVTFRKTGERNPFERKYEDRRIRMAVLTALYLSEGNNWIPHLENII